MRSTSQALSCALLLSATACATSTTRDALAVGGVNDAVAAYRADPSHELEDLRRIAERVLVVEARAVDQTRSERAWAMLRGMGHSAQGAWQALEREPGDHHAGRVRAEALAWRAKLGDAPAWRALRDMEEHARKAQGAGSDPDVLALAMGTLDAEHDVEALLLWARAPFAAVRGAAVSQLAAAPSTAETRAVLVEIARSEPDEGVRAGAIGALSAQGPSAWASLEALARADPPKASDYVRAAALLALFELDAMRAQPLLAAVLSDTPSMLGVEVAQDVLVRAQRGARADSLEATAAQQILSALAAPKPELRSRAASAALAAAAGAERTALRDQLALRLPAERDRRVHVLLALALRDDPHAVPALRELARGQDVPAAQAAAELSKRRDPMALPRLGELMKAKKASVRATAAAALARADDFALEPTQRVSSIDALLDTDARVRAATAVALLQSIEHLQAEQ